MKVTKTTHILFLALIVSIVFSGSLKNDFVWDDKFLVLDNDYIKSWSHLPKIFISHLYASTGIESNYYRPMQVISYLFDYSIWGLRPYGYHLSSLLLHILNTALVYAILVAVLSSQGLAFWAAAFFATAPAISGITYYIAARADLLMALCLFASLLLFIKYIKNNNPFIYATSISFFILSLLSREAAVVLPALLILELHRIKPRGEVWNRKTLFVLLPYLVVLAVYIVSRLTFLNFSQAGEGLPGSSYIAAMPLWRRLLTDFRIIPKYIRLFLLPHDLHMEWYIEPARIIFQIDILLSVIFSAVLSFLIYKASKYENLILYGAIWFLLNLTPVLNIYPISVFFGDGWLYVPSVGFFIILVVCFKRFILVTISREMATALAICFLGYYSIFTFFFGNVWKNTPTVLHNVLKYENQSPFIFLTYNNLGIAYNDRGEFENAIKYLKKSIMANPRYSYAYSNLGVAYMGVGRPIKAIINFKRAIRLDRKYLSAYCNLVKAYKSIGLTGRAIWFSQEALKIDPNFYKIYCILGYLYSDKDSDKAMGFFKDAARLNETDFEPHYCLGSLYAQKGRYNESLSEYLKAARLGLNDYNIYNNLAYVYIRKHRFGEAEAALRHSLALNSNQPAAYNHLGNLYSMFGYFELASQEYRSALKLEPANPGIRENFKKMKSEWKDALTKKPDAYDPR
jgi:Flp pilus assembly protein TadD